MTTPRSITVDFTAPVTPNSRAATWCIGADRAAIGLREDFLKQAAQVREYCGVRYIRSHGIFNDEMQIVTISDGRLNFNFSKVNELYDRLLSIGIKPYVELGFMPTPLARGPETIFWWNGNVTPPRSLDDWDALVSAFAQNLIARYGIDELATWYFEVWNEPDLQNFFKGTQSEYFDLYRITALALKRSSPRLRVGGPATSEHRWISEFLAFCSRTETPLDFLSTHAYCVDGMLDQDGKRALFLSSDDTRLCSRVHGVKSVVATSHLPNLPVHYTEWSVSYSSRDPVHDHYFSCSYLLSRIHELRGIVDCLSYWTFSDIFEELGPPTTTFHGGFGLLTVEGIPKPTYFLFSFLNQLRELDLNINESNIWCTRDESGLSILVWKGKTVPVGKSNRELFTQPLPPVEKADLELKILNLPQGEYRLRSWRVGYLANDAYTPYLAGGAPRMVSTDEAMSLREHATGAPEVNELVMIQSPHYDHHLTIREGDVVLIELAKVQDM